jgi:hypothetical protein
MTDPRTSLIRQQLAELGRRHAATANAGAVSPRAARVLVIGNFGNGNTGDEAMLARTLQELPEDRDVKVVSRNPRMVEAMHHVPAVPIDAVPDVAFHRNHDLCRQQTVGPRAPLGRVYNGVPKKAVRADCRTSRTDGRGT